MECFFVNLKKEREVVISKRKKGKKVHPTHKTKKILRRPTNPQKVCCVNFFQFLLVGGGGVRELVEGKGGGWGLVKKLIIIKIIIRKKLPKNN
jgi:hypothetical protein